MPKTHKINGRTPYILKDLPSRPDGVYLVDGLRMRCMLHEFKYDFFFRSVKERNRFLADRKPATKKDIAAFESDRARRFCTPPPQNTDAPADEIPF